MVFGDKVVKGIAAAMARQEITNATINGDEFVMNQKGTYVHKSIEQARVHPSVAGRHVLAH